MSQSVRADRKWGAKTADERRAERRTQIMRAALKLYGEVGYRNAPVKAVCDEAGLTERYFYESFVNSEALLQACFLAVTRDLLARMREAAGLHDGTALERVRAALIIYLGYLQSGPAAARVFLLEIGGVSQATDAIVSASLDAFGQLLTDVLRRDGDLDEAGSPLLLRGVIGGGLHLAQAWISSGCTESIDHVADIALRLYALMHAHPARADAVHASV